MSQTMVSTTKPHFDPPRRTHGTQVAEGPVQPGFRKLFLRGSVWMGVGYAAGQLLRLVSNVVLAWLLVEGPTAFALMAMVTVLMQGLEMFSDVGIGASIIRSGRGEDRAFLNTAWTMQVMRGVVLWLAACAIAWPMGVVYFPQLVELLPIAGLGAVLAGFNSTSIYRAQRQLAMGRLTAVNLATQTVAVAVTLGYAWVDASVWAMVAGSVAASAAKMVLSHVVLPGAGDRFAWDRQAVDELMRFGRWVFLSTGLTFLATSADRLLLGRLTVSEPQVLGVYAVALGMVIVSVQASSMMISGMMLPAMSMAHRSDPATVAARFHKARRWVLAMGGLSLLAVASLAEPFFTLLYDDRYLDAAWMAQLMAVSMWFMIMQTSADRLLLAMGYSHPLAAANATNLAVTCVAATAGFWNFGVPGFIIGYSAGNAAGYLVIGLSLRRYGVSILVGDAARTAGWAAATIAVLLATRWTSQWAAGDTGQVVAGGVGAALLMFPVAWLALGLRREVMRA